MTGAAVAWSRVPWKGGIMVEQSMYRPAAAAQVLGMGRTSVFSLLKSGRLRSVRLGGARYITADALRAFVRELELEQLAASTPEREVT
jgi:excisionase family DNA binding protein